MDNKKAMIILGGVSLGLATGALYAYLVSGKQVVGLNQINRNLESLFQTIENHFFINNDKNKVNNNNIYIEQLAEVLEQKQLFLDLLNEYYSNTVKDNILQEELQQN